MTDLEKLTAHVKCCEMCRDNAFGLCSFGFDLVARISGIRRDKQEELPLDLPDQLLQKPLVRMRLGYGSKAK